MLTGVPERYRPIDTLHCAAAYVANDGCILIANEAFLALAREHGAWSAAAPNDRAMLPMLFAGSDREAVAAMLAAPRRRSRCLTRKVALAGSLVPMNAAFVPFRRRSQERTLWLVTLEPSDHAGEPRDLASRAAVTAGIVHDLRTPVQLVLGWASLLRRRPADVERIEHALTMIERNAELLTDLLEDLLDQTRMAATRTGRRVQRIDLLALLAAEVRAMQPIADAGGVRLTLVTDLSTLAVAGDAVELRRVVINLVDNALKFTPRNGVVECRLWRTGEWAALAVRDNGPGISPEFLPRIFDPFVQETGAVARRGEGVGLGLAVVRQLVEFHGGSVSVASAGSGCGTTFTVRLPVLVAPALVHHEGHVTGPTRPAFADARPATAARGA